MLMSMHFPSHRRPTKPAVGSAALSSSPRMGEEGAREAAVSSKRRKTRRRVANKCRHCNSRLIYLAMLFGCAGCAGFGAVGSLVASLGGMGAL